MSKLSTASTVFMMIGIAGIMSKFNPPHPDPLVNLAVKLITVASWFASALFSYLDSRNKKKK